MLVIAVFIKKKKYRNRLFVAATIVFLLFSNRPLLQLFQYTSTKTYVTQTTPNKYYPVAVVMGGFGSMNPNVGQMETYLDRGGRLYEPLRLQRMGIVGRILVSGDNTVTIDRKGNSTDQDFRKYLQGFGLRDNQIISEQHARNTRENATYSISILDSLGYTDKDCLLVTSASHMKRAHNCFKSEGWNLDCYAVNIYPKPAKLQLKNFAPSYETLIDWQELFNEFFGNIIYKFVGYN